MSTGHRSEARAEDGNLAPVNPDPQAELAHDPLRLRRAFGKFTTGITIVTADSDGDPVGMTCNSFSSLSLDPPLLLWSLRKVSYSYEKFAKAEYFAVNVLASDQIDLSGKFAKGGPDKFAGVVFDRGYGDVPIFRESTATFQCRAQATHDGGDHLIIVGRIVHFSDSDRPPLVFSDGRYVDIVERPALRKPPVSTSPEPADDPLHQYVSVLLVRAVHRVFEHLAQARAEIGLAANESRLLTVAQAYPNKKLEALLPYTYMAESAMVDALNALQQRRYLTVDPAGNVLLTEVGVQIAQAYNAKSKQIEAFLFRNLRSDEIDTFRRVLLSIMKS